LQPWVRTDRLLTGETILTFGQESTDGGILAESNSAVVRVGGGLRATELLQEVCATR
jgi:hypothetical protein